MKMLIAYASRKGAAAEMARTAAQTLRENLTAPEDPIHLADLSQRPQPNPAEYDRIILGGSILAGGLHRKAAQYLAAHTETLKRKPLALFLSCLQEDQWEEMAENNFPEELRRHAVGIYRLGGRLRMKEHNFIVRKMLASIMNSTQDADTLRPEEAARMARELLAAGSTAGSAAGPAP